jgi:hypothetical protein
MQASIGNKNQITVSTGTRVLVNMVFFKGKPIVDMGKIASKFGDWQMFTGNCFKMEQNLKQNIT